MPELSQVSGLMHPHINSIQRLRKFTRLLDNAIAGDFIGTVLSAYIVIEAARLGVPRDTLGKMVSNILLESVVGAIPVLGDWFDFAWKANVKNLELIETHLGVTNTSKPANRWLMFLLVVGFLIIGIGLVTLSVLVFKLLLNAVAS